MQMREFCSQHFVFDGLSLPLLQKVGSEFVFRLTMEIAGKVF